MSADAQFRAAGNSGPSRMSIEAARPEDVAAIASLLREAGLPHEDFAPHVAHFVVARSEGRIVGAVGAEVYGEEALLRSLVVSADARGAGLGNRLVIALEKGAAGWNVERWWLLTTTAEMFFLKRGFRVTPRRRRRPQSRRRRSFADCVRRLRCVCRGKDGTREPAGR